MKKYTLHKSLKKDSELEKKYGKLLAQLAYNRNLNSVEKAEAFINPDFNKNYDPFLLKDMEKSVARLYDAVKENQKITIYADYDADGVPGSVIAANFLEKIGHTNFDIYIPHRHNEGYGIHIPALEKIAESGTELIITIDVGITAYDAAQWCTDKNLDLIISDHHLPLSEKDGSQKIPNSFALINPKQDDCTYPDPMLCGCGVMFKIIQAFLSQHREEFNVAEAWEKWLLDMVGISTISDMVPLQDENRIFAYYGMKVFQKVAQDQHRRPGLKKLAWDSGVNTRYMTEEDIAFNITPKINAASRMSHPEDAVACFLSKNELEAGERVKHLIKLNNSRKKITKETVDHAESMLDEMTTIPKVIVIGHKDWNAGIIGLVASKLVEKYQRPAFVWARENDTIKGSCRTFAGAHLVEIMQNAEEKTFHHFGGHKEAGGFSCELDELEKLEERLVAAFDLYSQKNTLEQSEEIFVDMEISADAISLENYQKMRLLAPFGVANAKPLFLVKNILLDQVGHFGKEKNHLEISFRNSFGKSMRAIAFFKTEKDFPKLKTGSSVDIYAHIDYSVFMGKHELRLSLVDVY